MSLSTADTAGAARPVRYGARLAAAVRRHGPLVVGIDPHPAILADWGLSNDAAGLERCARTMVQAAAGEVALVKPQSAFFEAHGSAGIAVLERVLADCRDAGLLSLLDVKRGDIGSTMDAYARAYLSDGSPLAADAITLSPYLGVGSLDGAIALATESGRGVYLLAATSNREAGALQRARIVGTAGTSAAGTSAAGTSTAGTSIAQSVIEAAGRANARERGSDGDQQGWGSVGVVVGITIDDATAELLDFSDLQGSVLAPGIGAQGGTAADVRRVLGAAARYALPTSSRAVMASGPGVGDLTEMIRRTRDEMSATLLE